MEILHNRDQLLTALENQFLTDLIPNEIRQYAMLVQYSPGETLIRQGSIPVNLYCLIHGRCSVHTYLSNGKRMVLSSLNAPCLIGEIELLEMCDTTFSVKVLEKSILLAFPLSLCRSTLINDNRFLRKLCILIADKEKRNARRLMISGGFPLEYRLAEFILNNCEEDDLKLKKIEIAETLGVSYRHLEKVMSDFVSGGYLRKEKLIYSLEDRPKLESLAAHLSID